MVVSPFIATKKNKTKQKQAAKYTVWKCKGVVCWKLKECQPNSLLCQTYHIAERIGCDEI